MKTSFILSLAVILHFFHNLAHASALLPLSCRRILADGVVTGLSGLKLDLKRESGPLTVLIEIQVGTLNARKGPPFIENTLQQVVEHELGLIYDPTQNVHLTGSQYAYRKAFFITGEAELLRTAAGRIRKHLRMAGLAFNLNTYPLKSMELFPEIHQTSDYGTWINRVLPFAHETIPTRIEPHGILLSDFVNNQSRVPYVVAIDARLFHMVSKGKHLVHRMRATKLTDENIVEIISDADEVIEIIDSNTVIVSLNFYRENRSTLSEYSLLYKQWIESLNDVVLPPLFQDSLSLEEGLYSYKSFLEPDTLKALQRSSPSRLLIALTRKNIPVAVLVSPEVLQSPAALRDFLSLLPDSSQLSSRQHRILEEISKRRSTFFPYLFSGSGPYRVQGTTLITRHLEHPEGGILNMNKINVGYFDLLSARAPTSSKILNGLVLIPLHPQK